MYAVTVRVVLGEGSASISPAVIQSFKERVDAVWIPVFRMVICWLIKWVTLTVS